MGLGEMIPWTQDGGTRMLSSTGFTFPQEVAFLDQEPSVLAVTFVCVCLLLS